MDRETELEIVRRSYAKRVMFAAGVHDRRVEAGFASVSREHFLGRGPWSILRWNSGYVPTPSRNPVYIYDDVLIGTVPERGLNNGQPSLHALLVASAAPRCGEHAVRVGAGLGYYTAILAHLVGRRGRVTAIEYDPALATKLAANFKGKPNVRCIQGDGTRVEFDIADVIYVNAGATRPADIWLDRLANGGRLILPLTTTQGFMGAAAVPIERRGAVFRIERRGEDFWRRESLELAFFPAKADATRHRKRCSGPLSKRVAQSASHGSIGKTICPKNAAGCALQVGASPTNEGRRKAHVLSLGIGAAPSLGCAGADKIALNIGQPAEYRQHQPPGAAGAVGPRFRQRSKLRLGVHDSFDDGEEVTKVLRASRDGVARRGDRARYSRFSGAAPHKGPDRGAPVRSPSRSVQRSLSLVFIALSDPVKRALRIIPNRFTLVAVAGAEA
jgi:protein-L-isoaspartate(D-aspartate) O-methyltransferase